MAPAERCGPNADSPGVRPPGDGDEPMDEGTREWLNKIEGKFDSALERLSDHETRLTLQEERQRLASNGTMQIRKMVRETQECVQQVNRDFIKHTEEERGERRFMAGVAAAVGAAIALIPTALALLGAFG